MSTDHITRLKEALEAWDRRTSAPEAQGNSNEACFQRHKNSTLWDMFVQDQVKPEFARELLERLEQAEKDARRYRWLRDHECNSLHLSRDGDHACNYMTASDWIDNNSNWYDEVPEEELQRMRESNTIWALQIYPHTPVGFNWWHGATLDAAIDAAIASHEAPPADGGGQSGGKTASVATKCLSGNDSSVVDGGAGQAAIASQEGGRDG